ncbi:MAG: CotH kinase family protein, partial [Gelidibacter sp.]
FLTFSVFTSCIKEDIKNHEKELLSFIFESVNNPDYLQNDINGVIEGSTIRLFLPENVELTNLVASFEFLGERVYLNGVEQLSGITENDYNQELYYEIKAENGTIISYQLVVEYLQFTTFSFKMEENVGLSSDSELSLSGDTLHVKIRTESRKLIASFETNAKNIEVDNKLQISSVTENDFSQPITYLLSYDEGIIKEFVVVVEWQATFPQFIIETEGSMPIVSKDNYLQAKLTIDGAGIYEDFEATTEIRGRGNSTWGRPKKPYRIKLNKKASILGLKEAKNWVLLANHFDETLMLNAVGMKIGSQLGMKYTNNIIPVELTINGEFLGNYMLTEQIEVDGNRVNVKKDGQLLEMDTYFDEDWKFKSGAYNLPMQIKYPKLDDYSSVDAENELVQIKSEFEDFENRVFSLSFPNTGYLDMFDQEAFVNYLIVYMLTANGEINHPKSTFLHKEKGGKYALGPIWDFDWAFAFDGVGKHFNNPNTPLFWDNDSAIGTIFFKKLLTDPSTKQLLMNKWSDFKSRHLPELIVYIDDYAGLIKTSQKRDRERWDIGSVNFEGDVMELKNWVNNRANFLDGYISGL